MSASIVFVFGQQEKLPVPRFLDLMSPMRHPAFRSMEWVYGDRATHLLENSSVCEGPNGNACKVDVVHVPHEYQSTYNGAQLWVVRVFLKPSHCKTLAGELRVLSHPFTRLASLGNLMRPGPEFVPFSWVSLVCLAHNLGFHNRVVTRLMGYIFHNVFAGMPAGMPAGIRIHVLRDLESYDNVCSFGRRHKFGADKCPLVKLPTFPALAMQTLRHFAWGSEAYTGCAICRFLETSGYQPEVVVPLDLKDIKFDKMEMGMTLLTPWEGPLDIPAVGLFSSIFGLFFRREEQTEVPPYHVYGPTMTKRDQAMAEAFSKYGYMKEGSGISLTYQADESSDPDSIGLSGMVTQAVEFVPCREISDSTRLRTGDPHRRTMAPRLGDCYDRPFGLHPLASREGAVVPSLLCIAKDRLEQLGLSASSQFEAYFESKVASISRLQLAPTLREKGPGRAVTSGRYVIYHLENGWTVITMTLYESGESFHPQESFPWMNEFTEDFSGLQKHPGGCKV